MSKTIKLVKDDTGPDLYIQLTDKRTGEPLDLTTMASAEMKFRAKGSTTVLSTLSLTGVAPLTGGQLLLVWGPTTLAVDPGYYEGEVQLTLSGSKVVTPYTVIQFYVRADF